MLAILPCGCFKPPPPAPVRHQFPGQAEPAPRQTLGDAALLPRPAHLLPFQGRYRGEPGKPSGYILSLPESGWYVTTGRTMPGADVIFAHSDREPTDMLIAVAPAADPVPAAASDTLRTSLAAAASGHFNVLGRKFVPESFGVCENTASPCYFISGAVEFPAAQTNPLNLDAAVVYVFPRMNGSVRLIFNFPELYRGTLDHYVTEFAAKFDPDSHDMPEDTCPALNDAALLKKFKCPNHD